MSFLSRNHSHLLAASLVLPEHKLPQVLRHFEHEVYQYHPPRHQNKPLLPPNRIIQYIVVKTRVRLLK